MTRKLSQRLEYFFSQKYDDLPADIKKLVDRYYDSSWGYLSWEALTSEQRRSHAKSIDAQNPQNLVEKQDADINFREGIKSISVSRRNQLNAKRPRPARQKISDDMILAVQKTLEDEGIKTHNQCSEAHNRIINSSISISIRGFRTRWTKLFGSKKGT